MAQREEEVGLRSDRDWKEKDGCSECLKEKDGRNERSRQHGWDESL